MRQRIDFHSYCVVSIWFGCNSLCGICMLSRVRKSLPTIGFDLYCRVLAGITEQGRFDRLILSGGEVTTFGELERYVRYASRLNWFKTIQIQTNGRKLSDRRYLERLVDSGVNEFYLSIHGLDIVHDRMTGVPGSFRQIHDALSHLASFPVNVVSNSVLTRENYGDLVPLIGFLSEQNISEMQVWNYFPMERTDSHDRVVSLPAFQRILRPLTKIARDAGKPIVFKSFPHCLLAEPPAFFDSHFPAPVLPDLFWQQFDESGFGRCIHRDRCRKTECWGLSSAYVEKYGEERVLLRPIA
jgi:MoaA/NifB/PqqE/SkfB family radical SAM enzyme